MLVPLVATALYVPMVLWPSLPLYRQRLTPEVASAVGSPLRLACLVGGVILAAGCVKALEVGNRARTAWMLIAIWLAGCLVGEAVLGTYRIVLNRTPPLPCAGDAFFFAGYVALLSAQVAFLRAYWETGYPLGGSRGYLILGALGLAASAAVALPLLTPILRSSDSLAARITESGYPILDLVVLVLTLLLLRMTLLFRPGRVWRVWLLLLGSFAVICASDILFAYGVERLEPLVDLMEILSYYLAAWGTAEQLLLLRGAPT
jgi:hypothetical protein